MKTSSAHNNAKAPTKCAKNSLMLSNLGRREIAAIDRVRLQSLVVVTILGFIGDAGTRCLSGGDCL
jgi:hypothetical protein